MYTVIVTKMGKIIKIKSSEIPDQKRAGAGLKVITMREGDEVVSAFESKE